MKSFLPLFLLATSLSIGLVACTRTTTEQENHKKTNTLVPTPNPVIAIPESILIQASDSFTDVRDKEIYATQQIGSQIWMANNLRFQTPDSKFNPDFPSPVYGQLYDGHVAQTVCPDGWHLPSDAEWNQMEMALGMPAVDTSNTFWRGAHGTQLKATISWAEGGNGTNSSGFNGLASGFYFDDKMLPADFGFDGLGGSAGYWTATKGPRAWLRFLGGPLEGVNRFDDDKSSGFLLACRCVKD